MTIFLNRTIQREKILLSEAVLGKVEIRTSAVKLSNSGNFLFLNSCFFCVHVPSNSFLRKYSAFEHFPVVGYEHDYVARPTHTNSRLVSVNLKVDTICSRREAILATKVSF